MNYNGNSAGTALAVVVAAIVVVDLFVKSFMGFVFRSFDR